MARALQSSIVVARCETYERYAVAFEVECYQNDYTTFVNRKTVLATLDTSVTPNKYKQKDLVYFDGLIVGTQYAWRARVLISDGGPPSAYFGNAALGNSAGWSLETAGDNTAPATTYTPLVTRTNNNVILDAQPASVPTDHDHYEFYHNLTGTTPPANAVPTIQPLLPSIARVNLPVKQTELIYVWIRDVDTSGNRQAWQFLGPFTSSTNNLLMNGDFSLVSSGALVSWKQLTGNLTGYPLNTYVGNLVQFNPSLTLSPTPNTGALFSLASGTSVAANGSVYIGDEYGNSDLIPVKPGERYGYGGFVTLFQGSGTMPANLNLVQRIAIQYLSDNTSNALAFTMGFNTSIGSPLDEAASSGGIPPQQWHMRNAIVTVPVTATDMHGGGSFTPTYMRVVIAAYIQNATAGAITTNQWSFNWNYVYLIRVTDPIMGQIAPVGSNVPSWTGAFGWVFDTTGTQITIYWDGTNGSDAGYVRRNDGNTTNVPTGSIVITGLTANTQYYFYPYYDEWAQSVIFVVCNVGSSAQGAIAATSPSTTFGQTQGLYSHVPLSAGGLAIHTPAAGTGGTGRGGGSTCVRAKDMLVESSRRGIILARNLLIGEEVRTKVNGELTWTIVEDIKIGYSEDMFEIVDEYGDAIAQTPSTPMELDNRTGEIYTSELLETDVLRKRERPGKIVSVNHYYSETDEEIVLLRLYPYHTFLTGIERADILSHNFITQK